MTLKTFFAYLSVLLFFGGVIPVLAFNSYPTASQYMASAKQAKFVPANRYRIGGFRKICGKRPTVLDPDFDSWGGSYPGFIIMNPVANRNLSSTVVNFIYAHECGHQFRGADENTADAFAIRRGVRRGWLRNRAGMNQICGFISRIPADSMHPAGPLRCNMMRKYYQKLIAGGRRSARK